MYNIYIYSCLTRGFQSTKTLGLRTAWAVRTLAGPQRSATKRWEASVFFVARDLIKEKWWIYSGFIVGI